MNDYPMYQQTPTRTVVLRGKLRRPRKTQQAPAIEVLRRELTPPIQTDEERGQGDSINARLHRILKGQI